MPDRLELLRDELRAFVAERNWSQFHDPKNLAMAVGSEAGELLSEYRWIDNANADAFSHEPDARARIEDEVADVGTTLLLLCDRIDVDFVDAIRKKLEKTRRKYPIGASYGKSERP